MSKRHDLSLLKLSYLSLSESSSNPYTLSKEKEAPGNGGLSHTSITLYENKFSLKMFVSFYLQYLQKPQIVKRLNKCFASKIQPLSLKVVCIHEPT